MGPWQWWFIPLSLLSCVLKGQSHRGVFQAVPRANTVFLRPKRANSFFVEELLQGNLERECYEERCSYEEAREYFENTPKTNAFWTVYIDGDQCESKPCLNGGTCTDGVGGYVCDCLELYRGGNCERGKDEHRLRPQTTPQIISPDSAQCPTEGPAACEHFCTSSFGAYYCSCVSGYQLHSDGKTCIPEVKHPCGMLSSPKDDGVHPTNRMICPEGHCPWQVSVRSESGEAMCAGVILGMRSVLTSAHCGHNSRGHHVRAGNRKTAVSILVEARWIHAGFKGGLPQNDLVLLLLAQPLPLGPDLIPLCLPTKDFSENVLMRAQKTGMTGAPEPAASSSAGPHLTYLAPERCHYRHLSNKMFCMENPEGEPDVEDKRSNSSHADVRLGAEDRGNGHCGLLPGSPIGTAEGGTVFLTGLSLSAPPHDCRSLVFTKLSRYLPWVKSQLSKAETHMVPQLTDYPV
ncbi:protein Z, vitamin K-dependent plasma glycoprotein b [Aplochiton taeniatus]